MPIFLQSHHNATEKILKKPSGRALIEEALSKHATIGLLALSPVFGIKKIKQETGLCDRSDNKHVILLFEVMVIRT